MCTFPSPPGAHLCWEIVPVDLVFGARIVQVPEVDVHLLEAVLEGRKWREGCGVRMWIGVLN